MSDFTPYQLKAMRRSIVAGRDLSMRVKKEQIASVVDKFKDVLGKRQLNQLAKHERMGAGLILKLSAKQLKGIKEGGRLGGSVTAAVAGVANAVTAVTKPIDAAVARGNYKKALTQKNDWDANMAAYKAIPNRQAGLDAAMQRVDKMQQKWFDNEQAITRSHSKGGKLALKRPYDPKSLISLVARSRDDKGGGQLGKVPERRLFDPSIIDAIIKTKGKGVATKKKATPKKKTQPIAIPQPRYLEPRQANFLNI